MARSLKIHDQYDEMSVVHHHYARDASLAVSGLLEDQESRSAAIIHRNANRAKHGPRAGPLQCIKPTGHLWADMESEDPLDSWEDWCSAPLLARLPLGSDDDTGTDMKEKECSSNLSANACDFVPLGPWVSFALQQSDTIALLTKQVEHFWMHDGSAQGGLCHDFYALDPSNAVWNSAVYVKDKCSEMAGAIDVIYENLIAEFQKLQERVVALEQQNYALVHDQSILRESLASIPAVVLSSLESLSNSLLPALFVHMEAALVKYDEMIQKRLDKIESSTEVPSTLVESCPTPKYEDKQNSNLEEADVEEPIATSSNSSLVVVEDDDEKYFTLLEESFLHPDFQRDLGRLLHEVDPPPLPRAERSIDYSRWEDLDDSDDQEDLEDILDEGRSRLYGALGLGSFEEAQRVQD